MAQDTTHARIYRLNDDVMTARGPASFIGYMANGHEAQVCIRKGNIIKNPIIPLGDITGLIVDRKRMKIVQPESQVESETSE